MSYLHFPVSSFPMASNTTKGFPVTPAPICTLIPQPSLVPGISDNVLAIILPTVVYVITGGVFYFLDAHQLLSQYRIHPSEDELRRNHVTKWQCLRTVARYHIMQISIGLLLDYGNGPNMVGDESCRLHQLATKVKGARSVVPWGLAFVGIDAKRLASAVFGTSQGLAEVLAGGSMSLSGQELWQGPSDFASIEMFLANFIYYFAMPAIQYLVALTVVDTWIYFTHRLCHVNKTLYRNSPPPVAMPRSLFSHMILLSCRTGLVHAQHHRLYVSYAYGAVYAHWIETLFLDILSFVLANNIAQLTDRQSMIFGSMATIKTISDHCGYVFPWDPFRLVNNNGAVFHDLHHQSWGLKVRLSSSFSNYTLFLFSLS